MGYPSITLTTRLSSSASDTRRGVVRLHPEVLDALGLRPWDAVRLTGARATVALAAATPPGSPAGVVLVDDLALINLGMTEGAEIAVAPARVGTATSVTIAGSRMAAASVSPETVRLALTGKVFTTGDTVSLLPQDLAPTNTSGAGQVRRSLSAAIGGTWTNELITIAGSDPAGAVTVAPSTVLRWRDGAESAPRPSPAEQPAPAEESAPPSVGVSDLVGSRQLQNRHYEHHGQWTRLPNTGPPV